jgi:hypothetical protein
MWKFLLSVAIAVAVAITIIVIAVAIAVAVAKARTPLFSLLVSKMSILDKFSLF